MMASSNTGNLTLQQMSPSRRRWIYFKRSWILHAMMALPMLYYVLFEALPLYGLQVSFRDYSASAGIVDSPWVGLQNFMDFFEKPLWSEYVLNTLVLSFYTIGVGFPIPIILALLIHINKKNWLKKLTQNVSYIPHFISVVVMVGILAQIFNPIYGVYGSIAKLFGVYTAVDIYAAESTFRHLYVWSGVWQNMGWSTIVYVAALTGVSSELHEAAKIDGASRFRRVLSVDLPAILPTVSIMLILRFGSIMSVGYEKAFLMQTGQNIHVSEILSTHIYKEGLRAAKNSYGSAIGLLNSAINSGMVILVNKIAGWLTDGEAGLF